MNSPRRDQPLPSPRSAVQVREALCHTLAGRAASVEWDAFRPADWQALRSVARAEGVAPLLYWHASRTSLPALRRETAPLETDYYTALATNLVFLQEGQRILHALHQADVEALLLKGAALAQTVYPDPALRPMGDLDVLIHEADRAAARQVMFQRGYRQLAVAYWPRLSRYTQKDDVYERETPPMHVEIHWSLLVPRYGIFAPEMEWFWQQKQVSDAGLPMLNPTACLLYLCAHHFLQHDPQHNLLWLYDIYRVAQQHSRDIDWETLYAQARIFGWEHAVAHALSQVQHWFGWSPPEGATPPKPSSEGIALPQETFFRTTSRWRHLPWPMRLLLMLASFFPSPAFLRERYAAETTGIPALLLYPLRWVRMVGVLLRAIRHLLIRKEAPQSIP